ncbi:glycosyltransferase [Haloprofundus halophilus]|uniref:glycosyltransferase n=1 Tax=Haloprofundus halophilus TaxID=2283527 RepID=UPI000E449896|nr:glycosyltransferase [Haloprofundus halophilus]
MSVKRVLFFSTTMGLGGADKQVGLLAKNLSSREYDVRVICLRPSGDMADELEEMGLHVKSLDVNSVVELPTAMVRLWREIREFKPDVVHSHMFHSIILSRIIRPFVSPDTVISTTHNIFGAAKSKRTKLFRSIIYRLTDSFSNLLTNVSEKGMESYIKSKSVPRDKTRVVHNGIDTHEFRHRRAEGHELREKYGLSKPFVWIAVGRLTEEKDYSTLITAFDFLSDDVALWIVGTGDLKDKLQGLVKAYGLDDQIRFFGALQPDEICSHLNAADAFVLSSKQEGFGIAIVEAMACQLPVVTTKSGGPQDIVTEASGKIVQTQSPKQLARAMDEVMNKTPSKRDKMGVAARERVVDEFSIESITNDWVNVYNEFE